MGCFCSKGTSSARECVESHAGESASRKFARRFRASSTREEITIEVDNANASSSLVSINASGENADSNPINYQEEKQKAMVLEKHVKSQLQGQELVSAGLSSGKCQTPRVFSISGEVNGWPPWLIAVAGDAIKGWVPRKADSFEKLDKIGQGTYSSVYRARDLKSGKIVALKKLEGLITSKASCSLYLVFEYMEHDLAGLIASPTVKFTEPQIKCYMQQLFRGLEHCHNHGVLHRDIKGSNLLIDNDGNLKIGDFGLANFFRSNSSQPLTSRVVTLWYRPPELLLGATNYGTSVDLWSAGCILAELYAGRPIMRGRTEVEQLHKIFKLCGSPSDEYWQKSKLPHATIFKPQHPYKRCVAETFKDFPSSVLSLLDVLLAVEPEARGSASSALQSEFFTIEPLPCDPSDLPKYQPSKEIDAKLRDEKARRQKAAASKGPENDPSTKDSKESKAVSAPHANAEKQESTQNQQEELNSRGNRQQNNPEEGGGHSHNRESSIGTSQDAVSVLSRNQDEALVASEETVTSSNGIPLLRSQKSVRTHRAAQLSRFSNSVAVQGSSQLDMSSETSGDQMDNGESSVNYSPHRLFGELKSRKKDELGRGNNSTSDCATRKNRIHYSGPLIPASGNIEEMLKEHEKQIQRAVRKARLDKSKTK
ncbi:Cyclin-dependent kinase [Bertholletia excelsa]